MNKKGQIISLDFLISIGLIVIALGLLVQFVEGNSYEKKQENIFRELKSVGSAASENLVSSNSINCEIAQQNYKIANCINLQNIGTDSEVENVLGIPEEYEWRLTWSGGTRGSSNPLNAENIYSEKRKVLTASGSVSKSVLMQCIYGGTCALPQTEMTLKVWK